MSDFEAGALQRAGKQFPAWIWWLAFLTLVSRFLFTSAPYFVDGPLHAVAISSGEVLIQPPGYFLFGELGRIILLATHCSAGTALLCVNIVFSVLGVVAFSCLAVRLVPGYLSLAISFFYAFSVSIWFASDVHSTYASMSFFAPALLYVVLVEENWWLAGGLWALMAGFRPSDGIFVLPFLAVLLLVRRLRGAVSFVVVAVPVVALWYLPTMHYFGGHLLSPLNSSGGQANRLANGLLVSGVPVARKIGNMVHLLFGFYDGWSLLTPFVFIGLFSKRQVMRPLAFWIVPGVLFFALYFFSDENYLVYMIAPGLLLAAEGLRFLSQRARVAVVVASVVLAVAQMTLVRPVAPKSLGRAVINAYCLQYSGWAIRHQYMERLQNTMKTLKPSA